jgi:hypothetical protein
VQNGQVLVFNAQLTVGEVSEKVTVSGETIQLATYDSGTVNTQLDAARIQQLPQNGRNILGLAQKTVPGLEGNGTRANGLMQEGMEYSQDGAPMTNRNFGGESNASEATLPDPDSVQDGPLSFSPPRPAPTRSTDRFSKPRATTISVLRAPGSIRRTSRLHH